MTATNFTYFFILLLFLSCTKKDENDYLFELVSSEDSGINHRQGFAKHSNIEGAGVAVGDLNGDGLQDIFLVGDSLHGLYQNLGDLKFDNIFNKSGIKPFKGGTSVAIWDINNDGLPDIVLGRRSISNNMRLLNESEQGLGLEKTKSNILIYINQGNFSFKEVEGLEIIFNDAVSGITIADFDKNGLPDIAVSTWNIDFQEDSKAMYSIDSEFYNKKDKSISVFLQDEENVFYELEDEVFRNAGNEKSSFSLISSDLNNNNYPDIYITNDFDYSDLLLANDSFSFKKKKIEISPFFSMGIDAADINNDGLIDLFITDMRPQDYYRQKTVKYEKLFDWSFQSSNDDIKKQVVKNTLLINQGDYLFSEISEMNEMDATDWSWSVLIADLNNNQFKDVFISNGYYFQDFLLYDTPLIVDSLSNFYKEDFYEKIVIGDTITPDYFQNFFFQNIDGLNFKNKKNTWINTQPLNTRGAAYADLDNDGDLELILNNNKQESVILKNLTSEKLNKNYLRFEFEHTEQFSNLHTKITLFYENQIQYQELVPCRGFYSSSEHILHFGLDTISKIDSAVVLWPNNQKQKLKNITVNQLIKVKFSPELTYDFHQVSSATKFKSTNIQGLNFSHKESNYNDFIDNLLLPKMFSKFGPYMAKGDLTGNGLLDIVVGGSNGQATNVFYQTKPKFFIVDSLIFENDKMYHDAGILINDVNGDGLNDIIIASGGNDKRAANYYLPRCYFNEGNKKFRKEIIPINNQSSSVVLKTNYNNKDLYFFGGRITPQKYPENPQSFILTYKDNQWIDLTEELLPDLKNLGMVSDALWVDYNNDNLMDLIVVGEYMSPVFFKNTGNAFEREKYLMNIEDEEMKGLWNCIEVADFNNDGYPDFILGNRGNNNRFKASIDYPLELFAADFDDNGFTNVVSAYYYNDKLYPTKSLDIFKQKINGFSKKYYKYSEFAKHSIFDIFKAEKLENAIHKKAYTTSTSVLMSDGIGSFEVIELPFWSQVSPIFDIQVFDYNDDGFEDIMLVGNFSYNEPEVGPNLAQKGLILVNNKDGTFTEILPKNSGFWATGDCRSILELDIENEKYYLVGKNNDNMLTYKFKID